MASALEDEYVRFRDGDQSESQPILLGSVKDLELDSISMQLNCDSCESNQESFFTLDEAASQIMIDPNSTIGIYVLELTLTDDNIVDPKQTKYRLKI